MEALLAENLTSDLPASEARMLFNEGLYELTSAGFTISPGSGIYEFSVIVMSNETLPDAYNASAAAYIATFLGPCWTIHRHGLPT